MSGRTYEDGQRNGVKWAISWLHRRAKEMNDPKAAAILNTAAFQMGGDASPTVTTRRAVAMLKRE